MSVLTNLLRCYEYCENEDLVDVHNGSDTVLLPIYHQSMIAKKNNILNITLDEKGNLLNADFAVDDEVHFFPITEDSVARSGKIPPPHPLEDKMQYCIFEVSDSDKFKAYMEEFNKFYSFAVNPDVKLFLTSIKNFVLNHDNYEMILSRLPFKNIIKKEKGIIEYTGNKDGKVNHNFKDTFLCFEVKGIKSIPLKVDNFHELHEEFIRYTDEISMIDGDKGICNISGNDEVITDKHRGLMGTAKVISVSNNKETYFGRFNVGSDIIKVGRKSSEKIHLMLKFLLENKNSHIKLTSTFSLVNWFSGDVKNSIGFDLTDNEADDYMDDEEQMPVSEKNHLINEAFVMGSKRLNPDDEYYIMLVDKSSNGRISIRYYKEMPNSQLINNLELWRSKYLWEKEHFEKNSYGTWIPTFNNILLVAYGIEQNDFLKIDKEDFKKSQFQNLVMALIEGRSIPYNIKNALAQNIRNRQRYNKSWNTVVIVSLAILSEGRKEYEGMREKSQQTRSYLYGRLISIYEELEKAVLRHKEKDSPKSSDKSGNKSNMRSTNALRYWNAFVNKPDTTMKTLELTTKYCVEYMLSNDELVGFLIKLEKAKEDIFDLLDTEENREYKINTQLNNDFIFGYYAQRKDLFTKKKEKDDE